MTVNLSCPGKKGLVFSLILSLLLVSAGCGGAPAPAAPDPAADESGGRLPDTRYEVGAGDETVQKKIEETGETDMENMLKLMIGDTEVSVVWEDSETVAALKELVREQPLTVQMSMYGGFEQVGPLGTSLPREDVQTVTQAGDIVLYAGNQIVVFYGSNSWAYTRLGNITDKAASELSALLGNGDVTITLSLE